MIALVAALVVPHLASRHRGHAPLVDGMPPVDVLVAAAVIIGTVTTVAVYLTVRHDLKLPVRVAVYAAAYEALVVAVKFGLAPYGLYHVNEHVAITESLFGIDDAVGATATAVVIFALYFAVYGLLYFWARRGVAHLELPPETGRGWYRLLPSAAVVVTVLGLGAGGWVLVVSSVQPAAQYLDFVFSSAVAVFTAIALAAATVLAAMVFRSTAQQVRALGTANLLVNVFLVGLVFLVLFHVLWVVYILVVTSIWPLNTVVPK
ncbi:MAG: hypothetical protein ABSA91_12340 [Acidimicrobiales bacterium]